MAMYPAFVGGTPRLSDMPLASPRPLASTTPACGRARPTLAPRLGASTLAALALLGAAANAGARPKNADDQARKLESQAISVKFLRGDFHGAAAEIEKALKLCEKHACSEAVLAHLHISRAFVASAGQHDAGRARAELEDALRIAPDLTLDPDLTTDELREMLDEHRRADAPPPAAPPAPPPVVEEPPVAPRRWISVGVAPNLALTLAHKHDICAPGSHDAAYYACFDENGDPYTGNPARGLDDDDVGPGFTLATIRVLVGYDQEVGSGLLVGARVGYAFRGGDRAPDGGSFFPFHLELRATKTFGEVERGAIDPLVFVDASWMEVDSRAKVLAVETPCANAAAPGCTRQLTAWRYTGNAFVGAGVGARWLVGAASGFVLDARLDVSVHDPQLVVSPEASYVVGF
jgi:hypothetical protein